MRACGMLATGLSSEHAASSVSHQEESSSGHATRTRLSDLTDKQNGLVESIAKMA